LFRLIQSLKPFMLMPDDPSVRMRRPAGQLDGSDNLSATVAANRAFPAAVAELGPIGGLAQPGVLWHRKFMRKSGKREFSVIVERDEEGYYLASVPELPGCHTQARSLDKLIERVREAIELCLEVERDVRATTEFIGVQRVTV
jgi:predicted RNase H-like HicB family nuclease